MRNHLEKLLCITEGIKDPCTRGTMKAAISYCADSAGDPHENHGSIFSFISALSSSYGSGAVSGDRAYETPEINSYLRDVKDIHTQAMLKAMANSAADSLGNPEESHDSMHRFFRELAYGYREKSKNFGKIKTRKYKELSFGEKISLFYEYKNSGMNKKDFVLSNGLSSVYALNKIIKDNSVKETEYFRLSEAVNL